MKQENSLAVVILTHNEEIHIVRCIRSIRPLASKIFVVDSFSTDRTVEIAKSLGAVVVQREWKNHAEQYQWALDHYAEYCGGPADWVMRIDADEYLESDLQQELPQQLADARDNIGGFYIRRKIFFQGKWIRHGGFYPQLFLRIWRHGLGRVEQRWMDEHIVLPPSVKTSILKGHFVDDNRKGMTFWIAKHNSYSSREALELLNRKYNLIATDESLKAMDDPQAKWKRILKDEVYSRFPVIVRASMYFVYRYIFRLGFLDGKAGFIWHFMQGYWYRMLVDVKMIEIENKSGGDVKRMLQILSEEHGLKL